jgi:hypothetical protein
MEDRLELNCINKQMFLLKFYVLTEVDTLHEC